MMQLLRNHYGGLLGAEGLGYEVRRSIVAFLFITGLSFGLCLGLPALRERLADYIVSLLGGLQVMDDAGRLSPGALFFNNLRACLFTMVYGLLPFLFLPALALGTNAMVIGGLAAWYLMEGHSLAAFLAALLPHGVFELPALMLALAMGLFACGQLTRRCRRDKTALCLWDCLALMARMLFLVLVPLLAAAALMEAYVTPVVAAWFS